MNTSTKTSAAGFQNGLLQGSGLEWRSNERLNKVMTYTKYYDLFGKDGAYQRVWIAHNTESNTFSLTSVEGANMVFSSFDEATEHLVAILVMRRMRRAG